MTETEYHELKRIANEINELTMKWDLKRIMNKTNEPTERNIRLSNNIYKNKSYNANVELVLGDVNATFSFSGDDEITYSFNADIDGVINENFNNEDFLFPTKATAIGDTYIKAKYKTPPPSSLPLSLPIGLMAYQNQFIASPPSSVVMTSTTVTTVNDNNDNENYCPGVQEHAHYDSSSNDNTLSLMLDLQEYTSCYDSSSDDYSILSLHDCLPSDTNSDGDSDDNTAPTYILNDYDSLNDDNFFDAQEKYWAELCRW